MGELVRAIEPHTEADPAALLVQTLVGIGSVIGRSPYFPVESDQHHLNLFTAIVGKTSKARKGTSWGHVKRLLDEVDEQWAGTQIVHGLSSGEGLIYAVRDPSSDDDPGVYDKRLLVVESELAKTLQNMSRNQNTLSATIRQAWDSGDLRTLTRNSPLRATGAHISIIGHITVEDMRQFLKNTDAANGFGNRFLWVVALRSKLLPEGGQLDESVWRAICERIKDAVGEARNNFRELKRDDDARRRWREVYESLSAEHDGTYGAITSRAEAQVTRLSALYAVLDQTPTISLCHLEAGLEVWRYCDDSARFIFEERRVQTLKEPLYARLRVASADGMSRTQIRDAFQRNAAATAIDQALAELESEGRAYKRIEDTGGRRAERWFAR